LHAIDVRVGPYGLVSFVFEIEFFCRTQVRLAVEDGAKRLLRPAVERTGWREAHAAADAAALGEFAVNLRALLMQRPLSDVTVLGLDPGFTSGCKLAVCSAVGAVLATDTLHPFRSTRRGGGDRGGRGGRGGASGEGGGGGGGGGEAEAKRRLRTLIQEHRV